MSRYDMLDPGVKRLLQKATVTRSSWFPGQPIERPVRLD